MYAVLPTDPNRRPDLGTIDRGSEPEPNANVLTRGFRTPIPSVPEDAETVTRRGLQWFKALCPRNEFHAWLVEDIALCTIRLDRVARIERRERDRIALRADVFWDDDRRLEAEALGARIEADPAATVAALERTPHGCDWMIRRWAMLARIADLDGKWDEAQTAMAFDLTGTPRALRRGTPGQVVDAHGRPVGSEGDHLAAIARGQVDRLLLVRARAAEADALDRNLAKADMTDASSPELRRLRRYEASLQKRIRWNMHQLQQVPKFADPAPGLMYRFDPQTPRDIAPEPEAPAGPIEPEARPEEEVRVEQADEVRSAEPTVVTPTRPSRPDPVAARAQALLRSKSDRKKARRDCA